ncbi:MAG: glutamine amidotransferase, partial [Capsulimonas sp.]|uniref:glutamine amidotransferase n=1 Tax=Capsulimonas sp. TaxID=2494211 RepID=UPI0032655261
PLALGQNGETAAEALVEGVNTPARVRKAAPFPVRIVVSSTVSQTATVALQRDGQPVLRTKVHLRAGKNALSFQEKVDQPGFHRYDAQIEPAADSVAENNHAYGFVTVQGRPHILYVAANDRHIAPTLQQAMAAQNIQMDTVAPTAAPTTVAGLAPYDAVVLSDVSADEVGSPAMAAMEESVRDFGMGLGMIGGVTSYGAGGYEGTPVETALPVRMDVKDRKRIPPAAIALVIEDLEEETSINWSIEAAKGVVDAMEPQDQLGVIDCNNIWRIPMQHVTDRVAIKNQMSDLTGMNDPPNYDLYLQSAAGVVKSTGAPIQHLIFFGDGDATEDTNATALVVKNIRKMGITVSTIASGADPGGIQFMKDLATVGGGKAYVAEQASDLPRLLLKDQQTVSKQLIIEKPFLAREDFTDDITGSLNWASAPPLLGYDIATAKPGAIVPLTAPEHNDPLFAHWRYGLGRTFAFTSDDQAHWAAPWLPWAGYPQFWAHVLRWSLRSNTDADFAANVENANGKGRLSVDALNSGGFVNNAKLTARVVSPDQTIRDVELSQTGPGHYESTFDTDQTGAYMVNVQRAPDPSKPNAPSSSQSLGLVVPYSPEYRTVTPNLPLLTRLTDATGGRFQTDPTRIFRDAPIWEVGRMELAPLLLTLAALLFLFDVAVRRLGLRASQIRDAAVQGVEAAEAKAESVKKERARRRDPAPQMARLLNRKAETRTAAPPESPGDTTDRLLNRRAAPTRETDEAFPRVASLRQPPPPKPPTDANTGDGGYTNRLLDAKRRAREKDE